MEKVKSLEEIKQRSIPILKKHGIKKAAVFGSFARGDFNDESDVDILVDPPDEFSLFDLARLSLDLEDALGRKVDIVIYQSIYEPIRDKILREQVVILAEVNL